MKNILVTGSAGFIGFHICLNLLNKKGIKIIGIDNLNTFTGEKIKKDRLSILRLKENYKFFNLDISNKEKLKKIFEKYKVNIVINLAALAGVRNSFSYPKEYIESNILGFHNIYDLSIKYKVSKFLFASSSSVYGNNFKFPLSESDSTFKQLSFYALTKKINENIADLFSKKFKMKTIALRFFTVYGPFGRPDMFIKNIISHMIKNKQFYIYGYGKHSRDFTHIDDVVEIVLKIVFFNFNNNSKNFYIYNIGSGKKTKLTKIIKLLQKKLNIKGRFIYIEKKEGDALITQADNKLINKKFNKNNYINIEQGLDNYISWHKKYYN